MKKVLLCMIILCSIVLIAVGCTSEETPKTYESNSFTLTQPRGDIGAFHAETPVNHLITTTIPTFSWTEAENAASYTLEIASLESSLLTDDEATKYADTLYICQKGITSTTYTVQADLKKNQTYYWRVVAVNKDDIRESDSHILSFYYEATLYEEIPLSVGYADEWKVHEVGSKATVALSKNDFFGTGEQSLTVSFDREDTQRGPAYTESNGWVVVTRSLEQEFFGVDAFYFNFYYSGNDAAAYFRLIDEDNEYWYAPIKLATNAKQTIIIKFEEFILRTKGTPVMNEKFDTNYLKSVELVFEHVDGDGIAYFSDLRAIRFDNYADMFVDQLNFNELASELKTDSTYFNFTADPAENGDSLTVSLTTNSGIPSDQQGYGFVVIPIGKMLYMGDAFYFELDLSGIKTTDYNFIIRLVEEDNDVWQFKISAANVPENKKMLIPFAAFTLAEGGFKGDGIKQFYYIRQILFGVNSLYQGGSFVVSDFMPVMLKDSLDEELMSAALKDSLGEELHSTVVGEDGMIDNFESYDLFYQTYYRWATSTANKDEAIELYFDAALGGNNTAARFGYKTDLPEANYSTKLAKEVSDFTAISICAKDSSILKADATMIIYLEDKRGNLYSYTIEKLADEWKKYTVPFSEFSLTENSSGFTNITCDRITAVSIAFQYFYQRTSIFDFSDPAQYNSGNFVCVDNICFTADTQRKTEDASFKIKPTVGNSKIAVINNFDEDRVETLTWSSETNASYAVLDLSDDTASGEGKSLKMPYKCNMETLYSEYIAVDSSVNAKGLTLLMKGDSYSSDATLVFYLKYNNKDYKYQATISDISSAWTTYSIGFDQFVQTQGDTKAMTSDLVKYMSKVVLNFKNYSAADYYISEILLDEITLDGNITLDTNTKTPYAG